MRFEAFVAARYLRSKRRNRFISLITLISIAGVSVGVMALIVVMSVMTGFDIALQDAFVGNRAHITVQPPSGNFQDYRAVVGQLESRYPEVVAASPIIQVQSLLECVDPMGTRHSTGGYVIGIDPEMETRVTHLGQYLESGEGRQFARGNLPKFKEIVLGYLLADSIGADVGDSISVTTSRMKVTPFGNKPQSVTLTVSGIFQSKMSDFDTVYAYVDLPTAQLLKGIEGVEAVHVKLEDPNRADRVAVSMASDLGLSVMTWRQSQQAFFDALVQEKVAMFIILTFIILVAAFNITSTLIMVVMEKRRDIGILRTLGVSSGSVLQLFMLEGLFIGLSGTILGVVGGYVIAQYLNPIAEFIAGLLGLDLFNSQIYFFDRIPVEIVWRDIAWISVAAAVLTFLSTLYPAWSASRLNPVDALRYE
jgi:lipoprotein-releasing system permease protein